MVCIGGQLQGEGAVFAGLHRDGQVGHTTLDAFQRSFALHRHIFVEGALAVDGVQFTHRGLNNAPVLDVQFAGADGLPEPLAAMRLILSVRPGLQPCGHDPAAIRGKGGLGGIEVDAAIHQLHIFLGKGVGGFVIAADEGNHVVTIVELALWQHLHGPQHQDLLAIQREEVRALPHFAVLIVAAFQHRDKVPVEAVLALEQCRCAAAVLGKADGDSRVGAVGLTPDLGVPEVELAEAFRQVFLGQHRVAGRLFVVETVTDGNALGLDIPHLPIGLLFCNHAGVHQQLLAVIHLGGRTGEAAGAVVCGGIRGKCAGQILPVQQVGADRVPPVHGRPPHIVGVILIELVILAFIIRETVWVVQPAHIRGHVVGRAFRRGNGSAVLGLVGTGFL